MRTARELPPYEYLHEHLTYDEHSGEFRWRVARRGRRMDKQVGSINAASGYRIIRLTDYDTSTGYYAHRVAWMMCHGELSTRMTIDHINRQRDDNRITNLRLMSMQEQAGNRSLPEYEGRRELPVNVYYTENSKPYRVVIKMGQDNKHIGLYETIKEAVAARDVAYAMRRK